MIEKPFIILQGRTKVMEWLKQQPSLSTETDTEETAALTHHKTLKVDQVEPSKGIISRFTNFTVSNCIGIAHTGEMPSLSAMYPGTDRPPLVLSRGEAYTSTLFITISDQEYLATASKDNIGLWNLTKNTSNIASELDKQEDGYLCVIDEKTVTCVAEQPSSDGFSKVYILNTDSEKFSLGGTITVRLKAGGGITDMCYVKAADGTPCLLYCSPWDNLVQCSEMVGGKVRWEADEQKMGVSFLWNICTDGNTVFVVTGQRAKLYLLSVEDGSVVTSVNLHSFGIDLQSCVRIHGDYLFVGHEDDKGAYCISKFTKPF